MRLGELGIVCREVLHELKRRLLVLGIGKRAGQLRESAGGVVGGAGQQLPEIGQRLVVAARGDQQSGERLQRAR